MGRSIPGLLLDGINNPTDIPPFLQRKKGEFVISRKNKNTRSLRRRIRELCEEDEFLLIIFDACRYDYFKKVYEDYYAGSLSRTYTTNTYTMQYLSTTWDGDHNVTYVTGGPVISDRRFEMSGLDYLPSEHFKRIIDVWNMGYDPELGVIPPEAVTHAAMECNAPRMVVHYFQPHAPYIGNKRLREAESIGNKSYTSTMQKIRRSTTEIYDMIENGEISEEELKSAYESNLHRVMEAAKPLVQATSRRTVITADHGELLGEDGRYMHGGLPHPVLSDLPWLEVETTHGEAQEPEFTLSDSDQCMEEQLEALGYL